jgi:riboflavin synthase
VFTGLVEGVGEVVRAERRGAGLRLEVACGAVAEGVALGDSVCVSGCCLSAVGIEGERLSFDAVPETLDRTWFDALAVGDRVNLERALRLGDRLGGHMVQGHVDGVATVRERVAEGGEGGQVRFVLEAPAALTRDMIEKGSVALDGVSLTLVAAGPTRLAVAVIPHTLGATTFDRLQPGDRVNVETDMVGKWLRRIATPYVGRGGDATP